VSTAEPKNPVSSSDPKRRPYRPPIGVPVRAQRSWPGLLAAVAFHALIIALLIVPFASPALRDALFGAGGVGPAGGGGGKSGSGGKIKQERLQYVRVAPAPLPPPVPVPNVMPTPVPPPPVPPPDVKPPSPTPAPQPSAAPAAGSGAGSGTGSGADAGAGSGVGTGGGTGSGTGTGQGSSVGAGTGGGPGSIYPPAPTELFLPPLPVPSKARGTIVVVFDVDSTGRVVDLDFTPTRDGTYNRKLREALVAMRFRPATTAQGQPVRARTEITYSL